MKRVKKSLPWSNRHRQVDVIALFEDTVLLKPKKFKTLSCWTKVEECHYN